jgi:hypothetical protein
MALRWYTTVIDCHDVAAQGRWWAETLGWWILYEADDQMVLLPAHATIEVIEATPFEQVPPGLVFVRVPEEKTIKNRLHLDLAPHVSDDRDAEIARLLERGATLADVGQPADAGFRVLRDPEGNEFCVLSAREN